MKTNILIIAMLGLCAPALAEPLPDAYITTQSKITLMVAGNALGLGVHVDTSDGVVTLHGKVTSELQRARAVAAVKSVKGVKRVRNLLQVVPAERQKAGAESDARIKERAQASLKSDTTLADSKISVKAVNKGAVLLAGKAANASDHLWAIESVSTLPGVRSVASEVKTESGYWDFDKSKAESKESVRDAWITASVKLRLLADANVPALDIFVDTTRGEVTLFGSVPTLAAKAAALADAGTVAAVDRIHDELTVAPPAESTPIVGQAVDAVLERNIKTALKAQPGLEQVEVAVHDGIARLSGKIDSGWARLQAAIIARGVAGVRAVDDALRSPTHD